MKSEINELKREVLYLKLVVNELNRHTGCFSREVYEDRAIRKELKKLSQKELKRRERK